MSKIKEIEWQPREVKSVSAGKRIGKKECIRLGIVPYWLVTMDKIYLLVGDAEQSKFWEWMKARHIPVNMTQWDLHLVWKAIYPNSEGGRTQVAADGATLCSCKHSRFAVSNPAKCIVCGKTRHR